MLYSPEETDGLVTLSDIEAAAARISGVAVKTPLLPFPELSEELGGEIRLKCESLQRTGAFKIRGAFNFLSQLPEDELSQGVITYSSGNHGQAVALAAKLLGVRAVVVMPTTAPQVKIRGAERLGAEVHFEGTLSTIAKPGPRKWPETKASRSCPLTITPGSSRVRGPWGGRSPWNGRRWTRYWCRWVEGASRLACQPQ